MSKKVSTNVQMTKDLWKDVEAFVSESVSQAIVNNPVGPETPEDMLAMGRVMLMLDRAKMMSIDQASQLDRQNEKINELQEQIDGLIKVMSSMIDSTNKAIGV